MSILVAMATIRCSISGSGEVWPDIPDLNPRQAVAMAQDQEGPASFPVEEIEIGRGRVVQYGRRLALRIEVMDDRSGTVRSGDMSCLYPAIDLQRLDGIPSTVSSGEVPDYFFTAIAGMRAGGVRKIILPRTSSRPEPTLRRFVDAATGRTVAEVPADSDVAIRVALTTVRRPKIAVLTTYSIPASQDRRVIELWCW